MVSIFDIFDRERFNQCLHNELITLRNHPDLPLAIANYSPSCQYGRRWNEITLTCRGLIFREDTYELVARPWKKFFNYGESNFVGDYANVEIEVTDKADGSLGILYPTPDGHAIATRGSFDSAQARHATRVWQERYSAVPVLEGHTFLFEIVYPANRIVLNYGDMDDLILLGAVNNEFGYYVSVKEAEAMLGWSGPVVDTFEFASLSDAMQDLYRPNAEGFVVRHGSEMVKLKQEDYLALHRIVTNINPKSVWENLSTGGHMEEIIAMLPDEFQGYATKLVDKLEVQFAELKGTVENEFNKMTLSMPKNFTRKDFALAVKDSRHKKFLFLMLDNRPIDELVWASIKPKGTDYDETDPAQGSVW